MADPTGGALPVLVAADDRLRAQLVPWLEGTLGWQVTDADELPAGVALVGAGRPPPTGVPCVVLVRDDDPPHLAARSATTSAAVLRWPEERDRLAAVVGDLLHVHAPAAMSTTVRLGGSAGGVGTTTVALALGGLLAWHGQRALVVASGDVPVPWAPRLDPGALSAHRTWDAAVAVAGVPGLRAVAVHPGPRVATAVPDGVVVLRDDGVASDVDVLVCARDRAGLAARDATAAAAVVVVGRGAVHDAAWDRGSDTGPRQLPVPWSARVGRAGVVQRVPASLPGRWLAGLAPLARSLAG
jgi:hypothetical protein